MKCPSRTFHTGFQLVRHASGFALQGGLHDICHLLLAIGRLPAATWRDLPQTIQSLLGEAIPPEEAIPPKHDGFAVDRELLGKAASG